MKLARCTDYLGGEEYVSKGLDMEVHREERKGRTECADDHPLFKGQWLSCKA